MVFLDEDKILTTVSIDENLTDDCFVFLTKDSKFGMSFPFEYCIEDNEDMPLYLFYFKGRCIASISKDLLPKEIIEEIECYFLKEWDYCITRIKESARKGGR